MLSFLISAIIYPVVVTWTKEDGWLSRRGFHESGLGSAVCLVGGTSGFVCNLLLGPRFGMYFKSTGSKNLKLPITNTKKVRESQHTSDNRSKESTSS